VVDVLLLFQPGIVYTEKEYNQINKNGMFKNYFKVAIRGLLKNPLSSFINVFGLAVAIGICIVVYAFMEYDYKIDKFHENKDVVFLTTFFADRDGALQQYGQTPRPLGEMLMADFSQIKKICRIEDRNAVIKQDDYVFHEPVRYVDPEFLEMFTFPLKWGNAKSLEDANSIILSEEMSIKYFGEENPIGQEILIIFDEKTKKAFKVTGVAEEFPKSHDIHFNFLINFENIRVADRTYDLSDWGKFLAATLIQVESPSDVIPIERGLEKYKVLQNEAQPDWAISSFTFEPLATLHERSSQIRNAISQDYNVEGRIGMPIIAIFMLALACFNYINIALVSAAKRLKEIGVRKVIGANRMRVIIQFLTENVVITCFALVIGMALGIGIFLPWFVQFSGWDLEVKLLNQNLWIFLIALALLTGIVSGIYPAFYISKFEAVKIFKGSQQFGRKNPLTKLFLGVQLVLACMTITCGVVFTQNNTFQNNRSWGYEQKGALYLEVPDQLAYDKFNSVLNQDSNVISVAGSTDHLGKNVSTALVRMDANKHYEVNRLSVDANYFETMGLKLIKGRGFHKDSENDKQAVVVNKLLAKNLNLVEPIGQLFEIDSIKYEVIGVLNEFHTDNFFNEIKPTLFTVANEENFRYLSLRVKSGSEKKTYQVLQNQWSILYPEIPFQGGYQEDVWTSYFHSVGRSEKFNKVLATIAVLLASLGLYGLVSLNVSGRVREFSIRKTLGANHKNITSVIMKQYVWLTVISLAIGAPISYFFAKAYLNMLFAYPMPIHNSGIIISLLILLLVLFAVIFTQVIKVIKSNPVKGLKIE
jgi:putative ABC transport system permease protein